MRILFAAIALLGILMSAPAMAGDREVAAIKSVLESGSLDTSLFTSQFLEAVPAGQLAATIDKVKKQIGPVTGVTHQSGSDYTVETATHEMPVRITLTGDGKIAGLLLRPPMSRNASLEDLLAELGSPAAHFAYLITRDGQPIHSSQSDEALAVGSSFKLGILKALKDEIDAGTRKWTDLVELGELDISLPSGILQTWPVGSALTIHTLATLMISISDNTATDTLMRVVGRDKVEAALGVAPVMTTRELFVLKANGALRHRYAVGNETEKRAILAEADAQPLPDGASALTPYDADIEYNLSPRKLCALMGSVAELDVFTVNPGLAQASGWKAVAFKGGSETGVLSLTTRGVARDGTVYCFSAIWNDRESVDDAKAQAAYAGILTRLAKGAVEGNPADSGGADRGAANAPRSER